MSWQEYVDNSLVGTQMVTKACLAGHDGSIWATSNGFNVSLEEVKTLFSGFEDNATIQAKGIDVAKEHYFVIHASESSIYGKMKATGVAIVKTHKAIIISFYDDKIQPGQCAKVTENLGDYLRQQTF